ncbi:hypothetical protein VZG28_04985 [Synechococcus elongatus IITB4]|uniref:hypothetical protein n=1 Tax=Synechococcus elongatus TaxID=32046 RepID=UPI0030D5E8B1
MKKKPTPEEFLQSKARALPAAGQTSAPEGSVDQVYAQTSQRNRPGGGRRKLSSQPPEDQGPMQGPAIPMGGQVDPNYKPPQQKQQPKKQPQQQQAPTQSDPPVADTPTPEQAEKRQGAFSLASAWNRISQFAMEKGQLPFIPGERPLWQNAAIASGAVGAVAVPGILLAQSAMDSDENQLPIVVQPQNQGRSRSEERSNG